jgi:sialate O-acetylesterase
MMTTILRKVMIAGAACGLCGGLGAADLRLPNIFADHMVLQRDKPVRIWGWAGKGAEVSVGFGGRTETTKASDDGKWVVTFTAMAANAVPQSLGVKTGGGESLSLEDVLVGDVWICGGQSNMEFRLRNAVGADVELGSANFPGIRFIRIEPEGTPAPKDDFPKANGAGEWLPCTPETIGDCSGVAYFFGKDLHRRLGVPIGLVNSSWGGTMAQHWVTGETLATLPKAKPYLDAFAEQRRAWEEGGREEGAAKRYAEDAAKWETLARAAEAKGEKAPGKPNPNNYRDPAQGRIPAGPLNAMIMPMAGLSVRGAIFYQGENNSFGDTWQPFMETFPAVIADWRMIFRDVKMPFGIIQIAGWSTRRTMTYDMNHHTNIVREVQFNTWRNTPGTGLIVSFDANSNDSIHPANKRPVGERAARWALSAVHGLTDPNGGKPLQWQGPVYESMNKAGERIVVSFAKEGSEGLRLDRADARGFYIAGEDKEFHPADARVSGPATVEVWSPDVKEPVAVRYASSNLPLGSLMNGKELPAFPFRTDTWPLRPHGGDSEYRVEAGE